MPKPNLLFVYADQLRYEAMSTSGNPVIQTPHFQQLADEGLVLDNAFSSCPVCAPYRGQLLTGRYSHANGVMDNSYLLHEGEETIADVLRGAGYRTLYVGKTHLGFGPYPERKRLGFDELLAYNANHSYYNVKYWRNEEGPFPMPDYSPNVETDLTTDWVRDHVGNRPDTPFGIVLSWSTPHSNAGGRARNYDQYPQEFNIYDPDRIELRDNVPVSLEAYARVQIADYYGMTMSLDACMGRLMSVLGELGLADNTIVCFSSDHGDHLQSHGYGYPGNDWLHHTKQAAKITPHEESIHIPFIIRYPSAIGAGTSDDVMFSSVDVMPTLLGLCGLPVPPQVQGTDLSSVMTGQGGERPDSVYLQILGPGGPEREKLVGLWRGVRTPDVTYARWHDRDGLRVLYDLAKDPCETNNVVGDPAYRRLATEMEKRLGRWISDTDDPFDTGNRLPQTEMLDLGQAFSDQKSYDVAPPEYRKAIEKYKLPHML